MEKERDRFNLKLEKLKDKQEVFNARFKSVEEKEILLK